MKKIPLRGIRGNGKYALVDDEDYEMLSRFKWYLITNGTRMYCASSVYNKTTKKVVNTRMHRMIVGKIEDGLVVDHINNNGLDNQKSNLRVVTTSENCKNIPIRKNKTGLRLITKDYKNKGYIVNYTTSDGVRSKKKVRQLENAIKFRDEILKLHYNFKSNINSIRH